jgi:hypothetical protein
VWTSQHVCCMLHVEGAYWLSTYEAQYLYNKRHYFVVAMTRRLQDGRFNVIIAASQGLRQYFQTIVTQNTLAWHSRVTLLLMNAKEIRNIEAIMKACISRVASQNSIIFFTDIRVQLPLQFLEHIRKVGLLRIRLSKIFSLSTATMEESVRR